jgi:hypothetical protein
MSSDQSRRPRRSLPPTSTKRRSGSESKSKKKADGLPVAAIVVLVGLVAVSMITVVAGRFMGRWGSESDQPAGVPASPSIAVASPDSPPTNYSRIPYLERLSRYKTHLTRLGPSPQPYQSEVPPNGIVEVNYSTPSQPLKAWLWVPPTASPTSKVPGVIYCHGGWAFASADFSDALPFVDAGFAVMCPMFRGENGNPGNFEMYFGEVEDAKTAISWFASQDRVDPNRIYTFGHSAGGVISSLLSLHDVPIRYSGSSGGLYGYYSFPRMGDLVPFELNDPSEREMRSLIGNTRWMKHQHVAYAGRGDVGQELAAAKADAAGQPLLTIIEVDGDHQASLLPSAQAFVKHILENP